MSYIGMVTNMIGGIMDAIAANQENAAMQSTFNSELAQQGRLGNQAYGTLLASLPSQGADAATAAIDKGAGNRVAAYSTALNTPLYANQGPGDSSPYAATDRAALNLQGSALAKVGGLSDWQLNNAINNIKTNEALRRVNYRASGAAQTYPYQMYDAQHSWDQLSFWGNMLKSIGGGSGGSAQQAGSPPNYTPQLNNPGTSPYAGEDLGGGMDTSGMV